MLKVRKPRTRVLHGPTASEVCDRERVHILVDAAISLLLEPVAVPYPVPPYLVGDRRPVDVVGPSRSWPLANPRPGRTPWSACRTSPDGRPPSQGCVKEVQPAPVVVSGAIPRADPRGRAAPRGCGCRASGTHAGYAPWPCRSQRTEPPLCRGPSRAGRGG